MVSSRLRAPAAGALAGAVAGFVLLGLGSRLAMRLIAVWTEAETLVTLNGAVVGETTLGGTLGIAVRGAAIGAVLGLVYVAVRRWLPSRRDAWFALFMLLLPGGAFVGDSEFELFRPPVLAVVLFLPILPLYGAAAGALTERLVAEPPRPGRWPPLPIGAAYVLGLVLLVANVIRLAT